MTTARARAIQAENQLIEQSKERALAAVAGKPRSALEAMASRLQVSPSTLQNTLRSTVFAACRTNEEFVALVVVANEYKLNPLLKEIFAFPTKGGGIQAMVSVDGWIRIMNEHPSFDGIEFDYHDDGDGGTEAIEAIIHRKDRSHPIKVIEYMDECKRNTDPWNKSPRRMLRHRALIQGARVAFGFSGIIAEGDEPEYGETIDITPQGPTSLPSAQALDEQVDEYDGETGEIVTDSRGMTEVDEDTARALDAGESDDAIDEAEAASQTVDDIDGQPDETPPWAGLVIEIKGGIRNAKNLKYLKAVEEKYIQHAVSLPQDVAGEIEGLLRAKRGELQGGEG